MTPDVGIVEPEYRHNVVHKYACDLIERKISLVATTPDMKNPDAVIEGYQKFTKLILKYFDEKIEGKTRTELEEELFTYIVALNSANLFKEKEISSNHVEEKILKLNNRMDSTDKLIINLLKIMQDVSSKLDKLV